jgi:hypothetical protein
MIGESFPEGYHLQEYPRKLIKDDQTEAFHLTNRPFKEIDQDMGGIIGRVIRYYLREGVHPLVIGDIGGGEQSRAIRDVTTQNQLRARVVGVNIDLTVEDQMIGTNAISLKANPSGKLRVRDSFFDIVYSYQFLPYIEQDQYLTKESHILYEIGRVLRPGGVALIHENEYSTMDPSNPLYQLLRLKFLQTGIEIIEAVEPLLTLVLAKKPVDSELRRLVDGYYTETDLADMLEGRRRSNLIDNFPLPISQNNARLN